MATKLIEEFVIHSAIRELADALNKRYLNEVTEENPLRLVVIANGAIKFYVTLASHLRVPNTLHLVNTSGDWRYPETLAVNFVSITDLLIFRDSHVLILEDICDSGNTVKYLKEFILSKVSPLSIQIAALLVNNTNTNTVLDPDYWCFDTRGKYVYGFGLDSHAGLDRNLNSIYALEETDEMK